MVGTRNYNPKKVYSYIYANKDGYNHIHEAKWDVVKTFVEQFIAVDDKLLDAGCGAGLYLRRLTEMGLDILGIDFADTVVKTLDDLNYKITDFISHAKDAPEVYNGIICIDVLEHIAHENINEVLTALYKLLTPAGSMLVGIAHHSDVHFGYELHLIQEGAAWWKLKLREIFSEVEFTMDIRPPVTQTPFYFFEVTK